MRGLREVMPPGLSKSRLRRWVTIYNRRVKGREFEDIGGGMGYTASTVQAYYSWTKALLKGM